MELLLIFIVVLAMFVIGIMVLFALFYVQVEPGKVMVFSGIAQDLDVEFNRRLILPVIHRMDIMDVSVKKITVEINEGNVVCKDGTVANIKMSFFVRVNKTKQDIINVAQSIGCKRASEQSELTELFSAKFSEAIKAVALGLSFAEIELGQEKFRDEVIVKIDQDLNGFLLDDAVVHYCQQSSKQVSETKDVVIGINLTAQQYESLLQRYQLGAEDKDKIQEKIISELCN